MITASDGQKQGVPRVTSSPSAAERHGHMGAAAGGKQGKGTPLETVGMKSPTAALYAAEKCQRPTGSKTGMIKIQVV